jgi:hypothetical protein
MVTEPLDLKASKACAPLMPDAVGLMAHDTQPTSLGGTKVADREELEVL